MPVSPANLSNIEVVVVALFRLGGDEEVRDTEDIAVEANRIAPGRFVWRKYSDQISLEHVRVFLSDAKKQKNGRLVSGDGTKGWRLTKAGLEVATMKALRIRQALPARPRRDQGELRRRRLESSRLSGLPAWGKFQQGEPVKIREAEEVFRLSDYVRGERRNQLIDRIRILFSGDRDFEVFVEQMAQLLEQENHENVGAQS
jgi:hypothetical protein